MKILMVQTRELCYLSGSFFLMKIAEGLRLHGNSVEMVDLSEEGADLDCLEDEVGRSYDAVIDINSKLPMLELDNGHFLLDEIGAPFFQLIIDHPLFHHPSLMIPIKNAHAIAIDRTHEAYIRENYPHYKSVAYATMPGTKAEFGRSTSQKTHRLIFTGTYESADDHIRQIESRPEPYRTMMKRLIHIEDKLNCSHEQALSQIKGDYGDDFLYLMNKSYLVDKYRRNRRREDILGALAKCGVRFTVMGDGWEKSSIWGADGIDFKGPVNFGASFSVIAGSTMLLDINPLFPMGIHDRVTTAFANRTVAVSDMNPKTDPDIRDEENIIYFDKFNIEEGAAKMRRFLEDKDKLPELAENAYRLYEKKYSWERFWEFLDGHIRGML